MKHPSKPSIILVSAIVVTGFLWSLLFAYRQPVVYRCTFGIGQTCTDQYIIADDRYCTLDPICATSVDSPRSVDEESWHGRGLAIMPFDPLVVDADPVQWLANTNLWLYTAVIGIAATMTSLLRLKPHIKFVVLSALSTWSLLEYGRWTESLNHAMRVFSLPALPIEPLPVFYLLPLAICGLAFVKVRREYKRKDVEPEKR